MKFGVIVFPGSNCDRDTEYALGTVLGAEVWPIWHSEESLGGVDCVVVPGGFSYGDYLRAGAIARFSPVMRAVARFADDGGLVLGICNGFQVLVEAGLLSGALLRNAALEFRCRWTDLRVERADTPFTNAYAPDELIRVPVAHGEGRYYADPATLERLERNRQVVVRYVTPSPPSHADWSPRSADPAAQPALPQGERGGSAATPPLSRVRERGLGGEGTHNPNGSSHDIAGIVNERGNVFGLMPHPERACEALVGSADGLRLFQSIVRAGARV